LPSKTAYVLLPDGYADWEAASAMAELRRTFGYSVLTIGLNSGIIFSMGGLRVTPDLCLSQFSPEMAAILVLPGGEAWVTQEISYVSKAVRATVEQGRPVAAICAGTLALAHAGLLNDRLHTSNGRGFLAQHVREYHGEHLYRAVPAITDRLVITANGLAPFAFAAEIFRSLTPERRKDIEFYENLYSKGLLD
jgi:putative intracellular protease/amidase